MKSDRYSSDPFLRFLRDNPDLAREIEQLNNEGNRRMEAGNLRGALRCFRRLLAICPCSPIGNNNAGACYFYLGQYELGAKHFQRTLADYPDHVFALAMLARCQTAMGELEAAAQTLQRATSAFRQSNPHRGDEVTSVGIICDAFAELEDDRGLFDFFRRCGGGGHLNWETVAQAGVAAFNLGRYSQAGRYWQRALQRGAAQFVSDLILAADLIDGGRIPAFRIGYRWEMPKEAFDLSNPATLTGIIKAFLIGTIQNRATDKDVLFSAFDLLTQNRDPWAEKFLWATLKQAEWSEEVKILAALSLHKRGLITEDDPLQVSLDGVMESVTLQDLLGPAGVDPKAFIAYQLGRKRLRQGDLEKARQSFLKSLANDPAFFPARIALVDIYQQMGDSSEAGRLLSEINTNEIDEELRWLYWVLCSNQAASAGDYESAEWRLAEALRTAPAKALPQLTTTIKYLRRLLNQAAAEREAHHRRRLLGKQVRPNMSLDEAYHNLPKDNLVGMGRLRGLQALYRLNKGELVAMLAQDFKDNWETYYQSLTNEQREALAWLQKRGGLASFAEFESQFGNPKDTVRWKESQPTSAANGLWALGWIAVGTWQDYGANDAAAQSPQGGADQHSPEQLAYKEIVVLPREVMESLRSVDR